MVAADKIAAGERGEGHSQIGAVSPSPVLSNSTPDIALSLAIDDLYEEAGHRLDGSDIETQEEADNLGRIMSELRRLSNAADEARKLEAKPFDDGKAAVQERYKPVIARADRAVNLAKASLGKWLAKLEAERVERQRIAEQAAAILAQQAAAQPRDTLADAERHDEAVKASTAAARAVTRIAKDAPKVAGIGRAVSLRTYYETELSDALAALRWLKEHRPTELRAAILDLIERESLAIRRTVPGVAIIETRKAA